MKKNIIIVLIILIGLSVVTYFVPHTTGPTEVGVRIRKIGLIGKKGVSEHYYEPGATYFFHPVINDWKTLETKEQQLEMTKDSGTGTRRGRDDLLFKTVDGNDISLDVIITYRIIPDSAPYIIQHVAENDLEVRETIVRTIARSRPRDIFGQLTTEEFYKAPLREQAGNKVKEELNNILLAMGIKVLRVGTKDYRFNKNYQEAIEQKKIAEQDKRVYESKTLAAEQEWKSKLNDAQGEYNKMQAEVDGEFREAKVSADAYYEKQVRIAEATIAEGEATAEGIMKRRESLIGSGGISMVKLKYAEALKGKRILLLPLGSNGTGDFNLKTTDMNDLIKMYGIKSLKK